MKNKRAPPVRFGHQAGRDHFGRSSTLQSADGPESRTSSPSSWIRRLVAELRSILLDQTSPRPRKSHARPEHQHLQWLRRCRHRNPVCPARRAFKTWAGMQRIAAFLWFLRPAADLAVRRYGLYVHRGLTIRLMVSVSILLRSILWLSLVQFFNSQVDRTSAAQTPAEIQGPGGF